ncbi:hypothetical protein BKA63DRAFT_399639, partial [Paraphoma chrysanthemicola]
PRPWDLRPTFRSPDAPSASFTVPELPNLADAGNVQPALRERSVLHRPGTAKTRTCRIDVACARDISHRSGGIRRQLTMQLENDE